MKLRLVVLSLAAGSGIAFTLPRKRASLLRQRTAVQVSLFDVKKRVAAAFLSGLLVVSPALIVSPQLAAAAPAATRQDAATSSGSRVNKDANSLLRLGLPINNPEVRKLQAQVEGVGGDLRVKRIGAAKDGLAKARQTGASQAGKILASLRSPDEGKALLADIDQELAAALDELNKPVGQGSVQERDVLDSANKAQAAAADKISVLEALMVPAGYTVPVPAEYSNLPQLQGRAVVAFEVKKGEAGEKFNIDGNLFDKAVLKMTIDGYNAPITGGNFVDLVNKGFYNNMAIQRSDGFVVQTGNPAGSADGYVPPGASSPRTIPLEIMVKGDKGVPMYESTTEEDLRGKEATVLPFQSFGALGMARTEDNDNSASSQWFWLLFDSDLTPAGKNLLDGAYACFGYTTEGADYLKDIKEGDIITKAKVVSGLENLVMPK